MKFPFCTYTFFLICLISNNLFGQDWQLINPDYHYHFIIYDSLGQHTDSLDAYTVRVDSTREDTSFLNQWFPEETYRGNIFIDIYDPHFLQKKMISSKNGEINFRNPGDLYIFPTLELGAKWMFDSQESVLAQLDSFFIAEIYGRQDSIKRISLSSGDQILLSKSFGILQFPKGYNQREYYRQIGISGPDVGFTFPSFEDFFSYAPGDRLEYLISAKFPGYGNSSSDRDRLDETKMQMLILDTLKVDGKQKYRIERKSCRLQQVSSTWAPHTIYSAEYTFSDWESIDTFEVSAFPHWVSEDDFINHWDVYPHEVIIGAYSMTSRVPISTVRFSRQQSCHPGLQRSIYYTKCMLYSLDNKLMSCEKYNGDWQGQINWITGVGLRFETGRGRHNEQITFRRLVASYINGISCGEFSDLSQGTCKEEQIEGIDSLLRVKELTFAFENPVEDDIIIAFPEKHEVASVSLIDMGGRRISHLEISDQSEINIPVNVLAPGVYMLTVRNNQGKMIAWRKVMVRPG